MAAAPGADAANAAERDGKMRRYEPILAGRGFLFLLVREEMENLLHEDAFHSKQDVGQRSSCPGRR